MSSNKSSESSTIVLAVKKASFVTKEVFDVVIEDINNDNLVVAVVGFLPEGGRNLNGALYWQIPLMNPLRQKYDTLDVENQILHLARGELSKKI